MQNKKTHIGIVLHPFGNAQKGLEQYVLESVRAILNEAKDITSFTVFVKGVPDTSELGVNISVVHLPDTLFWSMYLFSWRNKCDTFVFFTESAPPFLWFKSIIVFLDAAYYYFGSTSHATHIKKQILVWWRKYMLRTARHVVTISNASKDDLVEKFSVLPNNISVIYPGFKILTGYEGTVHYKNEKPYFMYIGPIKERKNVIAIVEAYALFRKASTFSHKLFLVGRKSTGVYAEKVYRLVEDSPYKDSIIFKTSVTDEDLPEVYKNAEALVFPSLLEGFGLPILEALSLECPVITSYTTSTKEVLGEAGILVDPHSVEEISDAMIRVAQGDYDREAFKTKAKAQVSKFSWERSGREWQSLIQHGFQ